MALIPVLLRKAAAWSVVLILIGVIEYVIIAQIHTNLGDRYSRREAAEIAQRLVQGSYNDGQEPELKVVGYNWRGSERVRRSKRRRRDREHEDLPGKYLPSVSKVVNPPVDNESFRRSMLAKNQLGQFGDRLESPPQKKDQTPKFDNLGSERGRHKYQKSAFLDTEVDGRPDIISVHGVKKKAKSPPSIRQKKRKEVKLDEVAWEVDESNKERCRLKTEHQIAEDSTNLSRTSERCRS